MQLDGTVNTSSGTATINLTGIDMTCKTLYIFNENYNGDYMTDYSSALVPVLNVTLQQTANKSFATLSDLTVADGNTMTEPGVNNVSLLGVQVRRIREDKPYLDGQSKALRYVASLSDSLKFFADDYGFEISVPGKEGVHRYPLSQKESSQNVISTTTPGVELFTLAVYDLEGHEDDNFTVKFYVKKGDEYAYGFYKQESPYALTSNYNAVVAIANAASENENQE